MRHALITFTVAAMLALGACGDDEEDGDGADGGPAPPPAAQGEAPTKAELTSCLSDAGLEIKPGSEPVTDAKGQERTRQPLSGHDAEYTGYVQWPSKRVADVYLAADEGGADEIENDASGFVKAFGLEPSTYVRRAGAVVMTFDDPPPSDAEAEQVSDCAGG